MRGAVIGAILAIVLPYLAGSFIMWDLNAGMWSVGARASIIWIVAIVAPVFIGIGAACSGDRL